MAEYLRGSRIALLAADGVGQTELDAAGDAVRQAGAHTQLLALRAGQIQSLNEDLEPARVYTVDRAVGEASVDEYEALLLLPGMVRSHQLSSHDSVVSFVGDFITLSKPVGVVCPGTWTLLEAGVARGRSLPSALTIRSLRQTGASVLDGESLSPHVLRAFYSTIVQEFARLLRQFAPLSGEEGEGPHARLAAFEARRRREADSPAMEVAGS
ncbi:DJ-1/PfpI family protein [Mycobacterium parmense]|uniref:Glutamine amidotransferase n=1 Tax=Mycobacterium parmense TaxID=185642 RepID=A0A7I7YZ95_9MYCO|nr:DJ-1/PfpI family protein [Mycobacterium parmense]MCV7350260.1 DJ-1/PfpI family protein [Mycobacterium parmense]BBZ47208.1 glutamine amidotransferase [Mycobacterium parmense]